MRDAIHSEKPEILDTAENPFPLLSDFAKDPQEYRFDDHILDYFPVRKFQVQMPSEVSDLEREISGAQHEILSRYMELFGNLPETIRKRTDYVCQVAKARRDFILAMHHQPSQAKDSTAGDDSVASTPPLGGPVGAESRKTRLEGVDVSALPAGFGKRRSSGVAGSSLKKPKAPDESAPEIAPGSSSGSRESTPALF